MKTPKLKTLIFVTALSLSEHTFAESLEAQANALFNQMGAIGNVTMPQAFKGQAMNTFTGGSLYMRTPSKTYNIWNAQAPYIRGSCGGIDAFGGSFSFISADQLKDMLKNITSAIPGLMFQMALKSVEPLLGSTSEWFQGLQHLQNIKNINSCEAAKTIVGTVGEKLGINATDTCRTIGHAIMDADEADRRCRKSSEVSAALQGDKDNLKRLEGNLMFKALSTMKHLDTQDINLIISITGTTVYPPSADGNTFPKTCPPTITSVKDILKGEGNSDDTVVVKLINNTDTDCSVADYTMVSISQTVKTYLDTISNKIATGSAVTQSEINFINNTSVPVYRFLAVANTLSNAQGPIASNNASAIMAKLIDYIAIEYASAILNRAIKYSGGAQNISGQLIGVQSETLRHHLGNAEKAVFALNQERNLAENRMTTLKTVADEVREMENNFRTHLPQEYINALSFKG